MLKRQDYNVEMLNLIKIFRPNLVVKVREGASITDLPKNPHRAWLGG